MKNLTILLIVSLVSVSAYPQLFHANITFESNGQLIEIDTSQPFNVWQIGTPNKSYMDSAYSTPFAIISDTLNTYPINNFSSFQVKIIPNLFGWLWGTGSIRFMHKYDFELNKDGGFIEVKYDADTNWTNIILDTIPEIFVYGSNFYSKSDTITENIPAFTGNSNGWVLSQIDWAWCMMVKSYFHDSLTIRFSCKSDSIETNQEGWLIDDIEIVLYECTGSIDNFNSKFNISKVIPNPVVNTSQLQFINQHNTLTKVDIYNIAGKKVRSIETTFNHIDIKGQYYNQGTYIYHIIQDNVNLSTGKFIIIK